MKQQSKSMAAIEAITNLGTSYILGVAVISVVAPLYDVKVDIAQALLFTGWFPLITLFRVYIRRRIYTRLFHPYQSRTMSAIEIASDVLLGFALALCVMIFVAPVHEIIIPGAIVIEYTLFFTAVSLLRSYLLRRLFNKINKTRRKKCPKTKQ